MWETQQHWSHNYPLQETALTIVQAACRDIEMVYYATKHRIIADKYSRVSPVSILVIEQISQPKQGVMKVKSAQKVKNHELLCAWKSGNLQTKMSIQIYT